MNILKISTDVVTATHLTRCLAKHKYAGKECKIIVSHASRHPMSHISSLVLDHITNSLHYAVVLVSMRIRSTHECVQCNKCVNQALFLCNALYR